MSLDDLHAQLRATLDQQVGALKERYDAAIAQAREEAAQAAETEFHDRFDSARLEWTQRLDAEVAAARAEAAETRAALESRLAESDSRARVLEEKTATLDRAAADAQQRAAEADRAAADARQRAAEAERATADAQQRAAEADRTAAEAQQRAAEADRTTADAQQRAAEADRSAVEARQRAAEADRATADAQQRAADSDRTAVEAQQRAAEADRSAVEARQHAAEAQRAAADAQSRLDDAVSGAAVAERQRKDLEQGLIAARRTAQTDLDAAVARVRQEKDEEHHRAREGFDGLRARLEADLEGHGRTIEELTATVAQLTADLDAARAAVTPSSAAPAAAANRVADGLGVVVSAIREIDDAIALSQVLDALVRHAATAAGRAALFLINDDRLKAWKAAGLRDSDVQTVESSIGGKDLLARAIQSGQLTRATAAAPAPPFARLAAGADAAAVPVMVGGRPVAVLYFDGGTERLDHRLEAVALIARHASSVAALRTSERTIAVLSGSLPSADDEHGARRYARLLVSEIKLYNEAAVRAGRDQRDLLRRLGPEIDRARKMYEERVPPGVSARQVYFQQELVQTLAEGDAGLLGAS